MGNTKTRKCFLRNKRPHSVHEMAHAFHTMLDLENEEIIENWQRVNDTGIYFNVTYINGMIGMTLKFS